MKILYCIICVKRRKFENLKISNILEQTVLSIIWSKCKNEDEKYLKKKNLLRY